MLRTTALAAMTALMLTVSAYADGIVGKWKTDSGAIAEITPSGGGFVITVKSGAHNGKRIGQMNPAGNGRYKGKITDPATDKTYTGNATLKGNSLAMQGCVAAIFCKTQNWTRQ